MIPLRVRSMVPPLISAILASAITWFICRGREKGEPSPGYLHRDTPEQWLLEPGTTIDDVFMGDTAPWILEAPDTITLHERFRGKQDPNLHLLHGSHAFRKEGVEPPADLRQPLLHIVGSVSTYRNPSACLFEPLVLIRFSREGRHLDTLWCFSCKDMRAWTVVDGKAGERGGAGISHEGKTAIISCLSRALPSNAELKNLSGIHRP
ncbi:hypothetical protein OVA24_17980 [Luteolibacter sp. SL250]|uniref:hypothetical protein n=1 Tax=Luteolibacter sp. SL250 TaxID=2995170 RepID=UPI002270A2AD|nr:hypothetical protein [Luteolibacter sp. SL250]WAC19119.1 hypothetical protein OVA24_17980 [Luteolibacter sp. SL250]